MAIFITKQEDRKTREETNEPTQIKITNEVFKEALKRGQRFNELMRPSAVDLALEQALEQTQMFGQLALTQVSAYESELQKLVREQAEHLNPASLAAEYLSPASFATLPGSLLDEHLGINDLCLFDFEEHKREIREQEMNESFERQREHMQAIQAEADRRRRAEDAQIELAKRTRIEQALKERKERLESLAEFNRLPDSLELSDITLLMNKPVRAYVTLMEETGLKIEDGKAHKTDVKRWLQDNGKWPVEGSLANWWAGDEPVVEANKPKSVKDEMDKQADTTSNKRECQLHTLIWRVYLHLMNAKGKATAQQVWYEIQHRHREYDEEGIIQEVTADLIQWESFHRNEPRFKKSSLSPTITKLKKTPPF